MDDFDQGAAPGPAYPAEMNIRTQIDADALLQREISHALLAVAETLHGGSDLRVVRILVRTLEASWIEHVSFQNGVIFPILKSRYGAEVRDIIDQHGAEHASLSQKHHDVGRRLDKLLAPGHLISADLEALLKETHAERLAHFELDTQLDARLAEPFTENECALHEKWTETRPSLPFPLNVLEKSGLAFPQLGRRVH